jgi:hypothetical protein
MPLDRSGASIRLQLAAQLERFLNTSIKRFR